MGPDAARYLWRANGNRVARPFNLRWFLPALCGPDVQLWQLVWILSWPLLAAGTVWWAFGTGVTIWQALATAVFLVALPGVYGPQAVRPVGVDLFAMALGMLAAGAFVNGLPWLGVVLVLWAACVKETAPVFVALWAWSVWPLVGLVAPLVALVAVRAELDPITAHGTLRRVHDHPVRSAFEHRKGRGRDAWLWVAPWGVTLAGLVAPTPQVLVTLVVAHAQCVVATDTVRLVVWAGPVMALAAARTIPEAWLCLAAVVHCWWWRQPELV